MATICDYCGDVIGRDRVRLAFGHNQEIALKGATASKWFQYCEDECADAVRAMLDNLSLFAMHGEGSGLMWQLVQQGRAPVPEKGTGEPALPPGQQEEREPDEPEHPKPERSRPAPKVRWGGSDLKLHPHPAAALMKIGIRSVEEAAERREIELLATNGVGAASVREIELAMKKKGLEFRAGASPIELGQHIHDLRTAARLSRRELAEAVDPRFYKGEEREYKTSKYEIDGNKVGQWETGRAIPRMELLQPLVDCFGVSLDQLLDTYDIEVADDDLSAKPTLEVDGARLRALRNQRGMSQREVGEALELKRSAQPTVSAWETGKLQPDRDTLERLAAFLGVPVELLVREALV